MTFAGQASRGVGRLRRRPSRPKKIIAVFCWRLSQRQKFYRGDDAAINHDAPKAESASLFRKCRTPLRSGNGGKLYIGITSFVVTAKNAERYSNNSDKGSRSREKGSFDRQIGGVSADLEESVRVYGAFSAC